MTYQPKLSSAFNDTYLRSRHIPPNRACVLFVPKNAKGLVRLPSLQFWGRKPFIQPIQEPTRSPLKKTTPSTFPTSTSTAGSLVP